MAILQKLVGKLRVTQTAGSGRFGQVARHRLRQGANISHDLSSRVIRSVNPYLAGRVYSDATGRGNMDSYTSLVTPKD